MSAVRRILWDGPADPAADSSTATLEKEADDEDAMRSKNSYRLIGGVTSCLPASCFCGSPPV